MNRYAFTLAALALAGTLGLAAPDARAFDAGWRPTTIEAAGSAPAIPVALTYPTTAPAQAVAMGPFTVHAALQAPPAPAVKGLILLSHGTGGSELAHTSLAEALARAGYLVAALRHPADNWQDRSLLLQQPQRYFDERPRQARRVIDALLADPLWKDRIARDERGPRVGALGHSAGGYTVLALAGGEPQPARIAAHCAADGAADPVFCRTGRGGTVFSGGTGASAVAAPPATPALRDERVRAVAALAPVGVVFDPDSLRRVAVPVALHIAEQDRWLVPRFHGDPLAAALPAAEVQRVPGAWHFAFMDRPSIAIPSEDGDVAADAPGFDREAFLRRLAAALVDFFDRRLQ